ncbi:MAG: hypothetical protein AVDCRST_MAG06-1798, partial [uncultured Nocardioides sp.]
EAVRRRPTPPYPPGGRRPPLRAVGHRLGLDRHRRPRRHDGPGGAGAADRGVSLLDGVGAGRCRLRARRRAARRRRHRHPVRQGRGGLGAARGRGPVLGPRRGGPGAVAGTVDRAHPGAGGGGDPPPAPVALRPRGRRRCALRGLQRGPRPLRPACALAPADARAGSYQRRPGRCVAARRRGRRAGPGGARAARRRAQGAVRPGV